MMDFHCLSVKPALYQVLIQNLIILKFLSSLLSYKLLDSIPITYSSSEMNEEIEMASILFNVAFTVSVDVKSFSRSSVTFINLKKPFNKYYY